MEKLARVVSSEIVFEGRVFSVAKERVILPNGYETDKDIVKHRGAVAVVPLIDDGKVVLLRQYRHAAGEWLWEIPAGTLEKDELPLECARRELTEETGCTASRFDKIAEFFLAPGYSSERIHIYAAWIDDMGRATPERGENVIVEVMDFANAWAMAWKGEIKDAKTLVALFMIKEHVAPRLRPPSPAPAWKRKRHREEW